MSAPRAPRLPLRAAAWMLGAVVSLIAIAVAGRELTRELSIFEIVCFRNALCLVFLAPILLLARGNLCRTRRLGGHGVRSTVHFAAQAAWFYGLTQLPLGEVIALEFTSPVWTAVLAALLLRERLNRRRVGGILLGFAGVLVILRPGAAIVDPAAFAVLAAAAGFALMFVLTRTLAATEHPFTILFWMNAVQLPIALALALPGWTAPSPALWPWLLVVGLAGFSNHYCFARAFALADASAVAPVDFVRLPLSILVGFLVYAEAIDVFVLVGAIVIFYGNRLNMTAGAVRAPPERGSRSGT